MADDTNDEPEWWWGFREVYGLSWAEASNYGSAAQIPASDEVMRHSFKRIGMSVTGRDLTDDELAQVVAVWRRLEGRL